MPDDPNDFPITGRFDPEESNFLSAFDGIDASGSWTLTVNDNGSGDIARFSSGA